MATQNASSGSGGYNLCSEVLSNIIVVEKIFKYLNARQLNICARVCKVWHYQAKREKESRVQMRWNCFSADHHEAGDFDAQEWWTCVKSFILDGPIEPGFVLIFCSDALCCHLSEVKQKKRKKSKADLHGLLAPLLPQQCSFEVILTDGIIGTDDQMRTEELEEFELALSLIMFGKNTLKQPNFDLEFVPFSFSFEECQELDKFWSEGSNSPPSFMQMMLHKEVKMVNLYCPVNGIDQEVGYSFLRMLQCPLIAGGYVNSKVLRDNAGKFSSSELNCMLAGFALCGNSVQVASVLIKSGVESEQEVDKLVQSLKKHNLPLEHSFALMYACVGRGSHVYEEHNVESSAFRKHFPSTPLLGFFGNGEIGCCYPSPTLPFSANGINGRDDGGNDTLPSAPKSLRRSLRSSSHKVVEARELKHPPKLLHAYTTVMCLISLSSLSSAQSKAPPPPT